MQFVVAIVLALIVGAMYCPFAALLSLFWGVASVLVLVGILSVFASGYEAVTYAASLEKKS